MDEFIPFVHTNNGKKLTFQRMSLDYKMKCPTCLHETRYIIQHLAKGKCQITVNIDNFKNELRTYKEFYTKQRRRLNMERKRTTDTEKIRESQNKWKKTSIAKQRENDANKVKEQQNKRKSKSRAKQRENDACKVKEQQNQRSRLSRVKRKAVDPMKVQEEENKRQQKHRRVENDSDRLKNFKNATK